MTFHEIQLLPDQFRIDFQQARIRRSSAEMN